MNTSKKLKILVLIAATFFVLFAFIACNGGGTSDGNPNSDGGSAPVESVEKPDDSKGGDTTADTAIESKGTTESVGGGENVSTPDESTDSKDTETNQPTESGKANPKDSESKGGSENPDESKDDEKKNSLTIVICDENGENESVYKFASSTTLGEVVKAKFDADNIENCEYAFYINEDNAETNADLVLNGGVVYAIKKSFIEDSFTITYEVSYVDGSDHSYKTVTKDVICDGAKMIDTADKMNVEMIMSENNFPPYGRYKKHVGETVCGLYDDFGYYYKSCVVKVVPCASVSLSIYKIGKLTADEPMNIGVPVKTEMFEVEGQTLTSVFPVNKIAEKFGMNSADYIWNFAGTEITDFENGGVDFNMPGFTEFQIRAIEYFVYVPRLKCEDIKGNCEDFIAYKSGKRMTVKEAATSAGLNFEDYNWSIIRYENGTSTVKVATADTVIEYNETVIKNMVDGLGFSEDDCVQLKAESKEIEIDVVYSESNKQPVTTTVKVERGITVKELLKTLNYNVAFGESHNMISFESVGTGERVSFFCDNEENLNQKIPAAGELTIYIYNT